MSVARRAVTARLAAYVAVCLMTGSAVAAEASFEGAWLEGGSTACEDVFSRSGKAISFKKPVNVFVPAFIIRGSRLQTPQTSCRIRGMTPVGDRRRFSLECATPVAVDKVIALLSIASDGSLRRYFNEEDSTGSSYKRCTL
jgi:hypothetical protein